MECKNNISIITGKKIRKIKTHARGTKKQKIKTQHEISPHNFPMTKLTTRKNFTL